MTGLAITSILIVLCVGIAYSAPCFEQHHPVCAPAPPQCGSPPAPKKEHHCREKDNSKEKKHKKKCKDKKKKKKKDKKKDDDEDKSISVDIDIDINIYGEVFTNSKYVDNAERDIYLSWMNKCTHEQLEYIDIIVDYLEVHESLSAEIINYEIFRRNINSVYEILKKEKVYSAQIDLHSQTHVFEKVKMQLVEAMSGLSERSALYVALNYCAETENTIMPIIVGLCRSVVISQETYFSHSATRSTSSPTGHQVSGENHSSENNRDKTECKDHSKEKKHEKKKCKDHSREEQHEKCKEKEKKKDKKECKKDRSQEEKHHEKKCKERKKEHKDRDKKKSRKEHDDNSSSSHENISVNIDIDINFYEEVFTESKYVDNADRDIYLTWMNECTKDELEYINIIVKYLQTQEALSTEIIDYQLFQERISSVYEVFRSSNIYSARVDLYSQTNIFKEVQTQVVEAMSGLSEQSALYAALNYCTQSKTTMMPLVIGLCRSVAMSQETYFSQTSTYTSTTAITG